jgi:hypothetical protein
MTPPLRPLAVGEVLDQAFGLFRRLFASLVLVQVACSALPFLFSLYVAGSGGTDMSAVLVSYLLSFIAGALASAAAALLISERYLGRAIAAGDALRRAVPKLGPLLLLSLGIGLVLVLSFVPFGISAAVGMAGMMSAASHGADVGLVGGVLFFVIQVVLVLIPIGVFAGFSVSTPSLVLEDGVSPSRAMSRSWFLTRGYRTRIIGLLIVFAVLVAVPVIGISTIAGVFVGQADGVAASRVVVAMVSGLVSFVITPFLYCIITLLYYDLRVRKEAFDLEMLAASLQPA